MEGQTPTLGPEVLLVLPKMCCTRERHFSTFPNGGQEIALERYDCLCFVILYLLGRVLSVA